MRLAGLNCTYELCPVEGRDDFLHTAKMLMLDPRFVGANITNPHKLAALELTPGSLSQSALVIGAVNTLWRSPQGWQGDNTDHAGFAQAAGLEALPPQDRRSAVVLGAGGTARAAAYALVKAGFGRIQVLARRLEQAQNLARDLGPALEAGMLEPQAIAAASAGARLVFNALSDEPAAALAGQALATAPPQGLALDSRYSPPQTGFMVSAKARGWNSANGLGLLLEQGRRSFKLWFGREAAPLAELRAALPSEFR